MISTSTAARSNSLRNNTSRAASSESMAARHESRVPSLRSEKIGEEHLRRFLHDCPKQLNAQERETILALSHNLPMLWQAATTTPKDRQAIARLLLEQVVVTVEGNTDRVDVELRWAGEFVSRHALCRPVQTYQQLSNYQELVTRVDAFTHG